MWLLFHKNAQARTVKNGQAFVQACPECRRTARFIEVELTESVGLFFVDVLSDTQRAFRCTECMATFDIKDRPAPTAAPAPGPSPEEREARRVAEAKARGEAAAAKSAQVEDELAAMKRRLGR